MQDCRDEDWTAIRLSTLVDLNDRIRELDDPADVGAQPVREGVRHLGVDCRAKFDPFELSFFIEI